MRAPADTCVGGQLDRKVGTKMDIQREIRYVVGQTDRQTDRQAERHKSEFRPERPLHAIAPSLLET